MQALHVVLGLLIPPPHLSSLLRQRTGDERRCDSAFLILLARCYAAGADIHRH